MLEHRDLQMIAEIMEKTTEPIRKDVQDLREDVQGLRENVQDLRENVEGLQQRFVETVEPMRDEDRGKAVCGAAFGEGDSRRAYPLLWLCVPGEESVDRVDLSLINWTNKRTPAAF